MAEYKYRALGWKDDDIASLNVVAAADNQVELQITKQGAGGTIDGPAIVGKDGITINKAADSEKIEISGSGLVKTYPDAQPEVALLYGYTATHGDQPTLIDCRIAPVPFRIPYRDENGNITNNTPVKDLDCANKKYVDDNFVKKVKTTFGAQRVYGIQPNGTDIIINLASEDPQAAPGAIPQYKGINYIGKTEPSGSIITATPVNNYQCANKKYVDEADKDLRLKLSNLEQALNGYILDTTEEAYADLDSAVLKNSVAEGDNVYPIADKTRALVTRIEGKTTKMVQLLDKSKFSAPNTVNGITFTNNGNGSVTVTGTVARDTSESIYSISNLKELIKGHKYLLFGCPEGGDDWTYMLRLNVYNPANHGWSDKGNGCIFTFDIESYDRNSGGIYIYERTVGAEINRTYTPQFFDLTAMNREDITTVEQFKAEFPDLYPYENGNIYPAKISGVKFTGKNLFNPSTPKYSGESSFVLNGDEIVVSQTNTGTYISANFELPNAKFLIGKKLSISAKVKTSGNNYGAIRVIWMRKGIAIREGTDIISAQKTGETEVNLSASGIVKAPSDNALNLCLLLYSNAEANLSEVKTYTATYSNIQVEISDAPTAYEPYIEPVSVTLPEAYDLHGIGDYKDYLEITKNENNELYTLKKVQNVEVNESEKTITPLATPVETVIATNLTYEQVTAIRHNGGLIEVEGNTNKAYARPTVTNTIVYRLTAANTVEV